VAKVDCRSKEKEVKEVEERRVVEIFLRGRVIFDERDSGGWFEEMVEEWDGEGGGDCGRDSGGAFHVGMEVWI
jgi:hypothetical protein